MLYFGIAGFGKLSPYEAPILQYQPFVLAYFVNIIKSALHTSLGLQLLLFVYNLQVENVTCSLIQHFLTEAIL